MNKTICFLLLAASLWGCSAQNKNQVPKKFRELKHLTVIPANAKPVYQTSFKKDGSYGSTKKVLIGQISGIAVDDSGRVYITDFQKMAIDVFEPNGRFLTHLGRKGRGPGEFETLTILKINSTKLFTYDAIAHRISIFSLHSFHLRQTINLKPTNNLDIKALQGAHANQIFYYKNNRFLVGFEKSTPLPPHVHRTILDNQYIYYYSMDNLGKIVSKQLFRLEAGPVLTATIMGKIPFPTNFLLLRQPIVAIAKNGSIFTSKSNSFLIREYGQNGKYNRTIYYPYRKVPLTSQSASNAGAPDFVLKRWHSMDLPENWPVLHKILIDNQNRLWVSTIAKNMNVYQWWVLNPNGKLLARFDWSREKPIQVIKNGYIYTKEKTPKGPQEMVRYRITMKHQTD